MKNCTNLYFLSSIACQLSECLSEKEIAILAADLATVGCMLSSILSHRVVNTSLDSAAAASNIASDVAEFNTSVFSSAEQ
ncbi:hypothetical protein [uncultured Robinsoniella sp.]|uniref:hypothetical protein n=1 Tax=uncultured Robinsoniella sp. TaxID=904190 RepID=UPI00374EF176